MAEDAGWEPPSSFDGFTIVRLLGIGGMGRVYLARETLLERDVAVKFIAAGEPDSAAVERFLIEARAVARLQHPNVVAVYRIGDVDRRPYVACEFIAGKSLDRLPLPAPWETVLHVALGIARGLAAAQARGILHRDIKPANIMVSDAGEVKLVDFGIAKLVDTLPSERASEQTSERTSALESLATQTDIASRTPQLTPAQADTPSLTRVGTVLGTPRYLAPELWAGARASVRSDVFSLGVVLYELCAGRDLDPAGDKRSRRIEEQLPPVRSRAAIPDELARVIDRCVALDPDARYASALELRDGLEQVAAALTATPRTATTTAPRGARPMPGEVLAHRYEILRVIGRDVYEALDRELDEPVALRLVACDAAELKALRQRTRLARRVSHPNACRVLDLGQRGDGTFVTAELLRGQPLRSVMAAGLSFQRRVDIVLQIAAAIVAAHQLGIAHGAIRPENVILEPQRAVLADFGLRAGDPLEDQRALAALALELLGDSRGAEPHARVLSLEVVPEAAYHPLAAVLARALGRGERFASVEDLAAAFAAAARGAPSARTSSPAIDLGSFAAASSSRSAGARGRSVEAETLSRVATALVFWRRRLDEPTASGELELAESQADVDEIERIVTAMGGTIISSRHSELLAVFGAPRALGDDVVRATRVANALIARFPDGGAGLDTGRMELRVGGAESGVRARGDVVSRALELARAANAGGVLASAVTSRHLLGRFDTTEVGPDCYRVLPGMLRIPERELMPLVGRDAELARLERLVYDAFEQRGTRVARVIGPAGAGKSRLRLELERRLVHRRDVEWLIACASPLGGGVPLGLVQDASREWYAAAEAAIPSGKTATLEAARQWLEERASVRPVVLALDDVHWADDASRDLLIALRRDLDQLPIAILLFLRPTTGSPAPELAVDLELALAPIGTGSAREIAKRLAPSVPEDALAEIVRRAGGNPFFLEELARHADAGQRELPASVELAVQARIDQLPGEQRSVVAAASAIGREFERSELDIALVGTTLGRDAVDRALVELERCQIVELVGAAAERYAFHHVLIRDVAYAQLDDMARRRIHAALAGHFEKRLGQMRRDPSLLLALASHRDAAGDRAAAREAYRSAGELALSLAAYREANLSLARAEELAGDAPDAALLELRGDALLQTDSAAATERFERAMVLATEPLACAGLCCKLATAANQRGDNTAAIALCERGLALLPAGELDRADRAVKLVAARTLALLGFILGYELGDHRRALPFAERAVELFERVGDLLELAGGISRLAATYLRAGRWEDRLRCNLRHLQIAETLGDLDRQLGANLNLGLNYQVLGRLDTAIAHARRGLELCIRCGRATTQALARNNLGIILCDAGQDAAARRELEDAISQGNRVGYTRFLHETYATLAILDLRAGELDAAELDARRAIELAHGSPLNEGIAARILAGVVAARGRTDEAIALLARAHAQIGDDDYERARTFALEAKLAARAGRDGSEPRERARAVFERLGAALDLAKLDVLDDVR